MNKKIIVVTGPTAIGKTEKAIQIALEHNSPIISADSRQLYAELNIGVARPSDSDLAKVKHYCIANISIHQDYNAGAYAKDARIIINKLFHTHDTLVVCGGTGLYINALLKGFDPLPPKNEILRNELQEILRNQGIEALQKNLKDIDSERYSTSEVLNPQRLIRAIEIAKATAIEETDIPAFEHIFETEYLLMSMPREVLYDRINSRVDNMIAKGLEQEAHSLYPYRHLNALQTVGYSEWWPYFEGQTDKKTVIEGIQQHSRNYAKRQLTWFKTKLK